MIFCLDNLLNIEWMWWKVDELWFSKESHDGK